MTDKRVLLDCDLDVSPLDGKQIGIVGYGSQGRAQALNLRDSGLTPLIGVRRGPSFDKAAADGLGPLSVEEASGRSDVIMILTPDQTHPAVLSDHVLPHSRPGALIGFATGFSVHFGLAGLPPSAGAFLVAPKGPGAVLRSRFLEGGGIPALVASLRGDAGEIAVALAYAKAIGCGRAGVIRTSFREETVADLFGEQSVLAGGMVDLMRAAFDILIERGYSPEIAYIECVREVEYMASLIARVGLADLERHISSTAFYGGVTRGARVIDQAARERLKAVLDDIESGRFAREFAEFVAGGKRPPARPGSESLERARSELEGEA